MPYSKISEAKAAGFPTHAEDIALTIEQINKLADIYDAIKKAGTVDIPMAAAWTSWKRLYKKEGDKWVLIKKEGDQETYDHWIPVAKANQVKRYEDGTTEIVTEEALISSLGSWAGKGIEINHKVSIDNAHKIMGEKYEAPFLYMNFDTATEDIFRKSDATGWSIKFDPDTMQYEGNKLVEGQGKNISVLYYPHGPTCTPAMGCHETFEFDMAEFESDTYSEKNETEFKSFVGDVKKGLDKVVSLLKGVTLIKSEGKKEEENQEENLDKKENMEEVEKLTSQLQTATTELTKVKGEFETLQTDHDTEVTKLKAKIGEYEQEKIDAKKAEMETYWGRLKETVIPVGLIHKEEDEKKLKAEFEQSPHEFMMKAFAFERPAATKEEGSEFETNPDELTKVAKELEDAAGMEAPHGNG
jgi:hypothetical protein